MVESMERSSRRSEVFTEQEANDLIGTKAQYKFSNKLGEVYEVRKNKQSDAPEILVAFRNPDGTIDDIHQVGKKQFKRDFVIEKQG